MWGRKPKAGDAADASAAAAGRLKEAVRQARIETAERTSVVVDLRDAEMVRLELLNEALDPLFNEIPAEIELFDRGISRSDPPRLWLDAVAHVVMGRDKRQYRFVQDVRYGRNVLAESPDIKDVVQAVTHYVASRLVERERALGSQVDVSGPLLHGARKIWSGGRWRMLGVFLLGLMAGCAALFAVLGFAASRVH
jgi:hypothetical protein